MSGRKKCWRENYTVDRFASDLRQKYKLGKYKSTRRGFEHLKIYPFWQQNSKQSVSIFTTDQTDFIKFGSEITLGVPCNMVLTASLLKW